MKKTLFTIAIMLFAFVSAHSQTIITFSADQPDELTANAGSDEGIALGESADLGGNPTATGGTEPYSYSWDDDSGADVLTDANPSVSPDATTTYTLVVTDSDTCTSSEATITISIVMTAINDFTADELKIYPNPATDMFTVDFSGENSRISLFNESGKLIWTKAINGKTTFPAPRTPGIYLLKINTNDKESVRKIVISK